MRITCNLRETVARVQKLIKNDFNIVTIDQFKINVKAGNGGPGLARYNGVGGTGGNVYFVAKPSMAFVDIKKELNSKMRIRAQNGDSSSKTSLLGSNGKHELFDVPVGTEVVNRTEDKLIANCTVPFRRYLIARGGKGGSMSSAYKGEKGESVDVDLHMKLCPNIGLLGFPNAGKSSLLKALVPEKSVKIGEYPFTTVNPQMAFWKDTLEDGNFSTLPQALTLSVLDLPGIIEGASVNRGMGYKFLKHLENADIIVMVVDCGGFQLKNELDCPFRTPLESIALLNCEIERYDKNLLKKPVVCVLNKIDILDEQGREKISYLATDLRTHQWVKKLDNDEMRPKNAIRFESVVELSAKSGNVDKLREVLSQLRHYLHSMKDDNSPAEKSSQKQRLR